VRRKGGEETTYALTVRSETQKAWLITASDFNGTAFRLTASLNGICNMASWVRRIGREAYTSSSLLFEVSKTAGNISTTGSRF
jgi:hypothetical protein